MHKDEIISISSNKRKPSINYYKRMFHIYPNIVNVTKLLILAMTQHLTTAFRFEFQLSVAFLILLITP